MTATLDRPCERWSLQETHEAHKFSHTDGWATCPGWGQPLTDQQLTEIRDRVAAATDGPWYADGHEILVGTADDITRHSQWIGETCTTELPDWGNANGAFVAHARQDIPALLAEVTRDRAELASLRAELEQTRQQLAAVLAVCDAAEHQATRWENPLPVPDWVTTVRYAAAHPTTWPVRACGCPTRFDRHADGCPTATVEATR